jgi:hypothetical protein
MERDRRVVTSTHGWWNPAGPSRVNVYLNKRNVAFARAFLRIKKWEAQIARVILTSVVTSQESSWVMKKNWGNIRPKCEELVLKDDWDAKFEQAYRKRQMQEWNYIRRCDKSCEDARRRANCAEHRDNLSRRRTFWKDITGATYANCSVEGLSMSDWDERQERYAAARLVLAKFPENHAKIQHLKALEWLEEQKAAVNGILEEMRQIYAQMPSLQSLSSAVADAQFKAECDLKKLNEQMIAALREMKHSFTKGVIQGISDNMLSVAYARSDRCFLFNLNSILKELHKRRAEAQITLEEINKEFEGYYRAYERLCTLTESLYPMMSRFQSVQIREDAFSPQTAPFLMSSVRLPGFSPGYEGTHMKTIEQGTQVNPREREDRRGPPRDRPPDKPHPWKGTVAGCTLERACTRHDQRASSHVCGTSRVSGHTLPLQKMQFGVESPSFDCHSSFAAGTSSLSGLSWKPVSGHRSGVKRDMCVAQGNHSPNLGRNLSLRGGFS